MLIYTTANEAGYVEFTISPEVMGGLSLLDCVVKIVEQTTSAVYYGLS